MRRLFFGLTHWIEEVKISYLASGFFTACLIVKPIPAVHAPPTITTKGITWKIEMKINLSCHLKEQNKAQRKNTEINMSDKLFSVTLFLQNESLERESSNGWWVPLFAGKDESGYYAPCQFASKLMFSLLKNSVCAILHGKIFKVTTFTSRKKFISMVLILKRNCVFDPFDCLGLHYKLCSICRILKLPFQDWWNLFFLPGAVYSSSFASNCSLSKDSWIYDRYLIFFGPLTASMFLGFFENV